MMGKVIRMLGKCASQLVRNLVYLIALSTGQPSFAPVPQIQLDKTTQQYPKRFFSFALKFSWV
jgi:hypothetical protein